jgi:hypothetical protein
MDSCQKNWDQADERVEVVVASYGAVCNLIYVVPFSFLAKVQDS